MPRVATPPDFWAIFNGRPQEVMRAATSSDFANVRQDAAQRYRHWRRLRYIARGAGVDPEVAWATVKLSRNTQQQPLPFTSLNGETLWYTTPDVVMREMTLSDQELAGRLASSATDSRHELNDRLIVSSLMEEAIASSQLEGASTVHRVAKEMLKRDRQPRDKHERMIMNNYRAMQWLREHHREPLTITTLLDLQRMITDGTLDRPDECGRFRTEDEQVVVQDQYNEVLHTPPPATSLQERLGRLCAFANQDWRSANPFIHPLIRASTLHFQLAYDHPFCDGNGRTARVLFYWMMIRSGYWMFEYLPLSRLILRGPGKYQRAFQYVETDDFDLTYFLVYTARLVSRARTELAEHLAQKRRERIAAQAQFAREDLNDRQRLFLAEIQDHPNHEYSIEIYQATCDVAYATARSDLLHLEDLGYLDRRKVGKKFVFTPSATPPE